MVEQMKTKILKSINFDAITPLNDQEMSLLVGGQGGSYSKGRIIAILIKILDELEREREGERPNRNCGCEDMPSPQK